MKKTKLRVVLILLSINLVLVNLIVSSSNNSNSDQFEQVSSLLPEDIAFTYNSSFCCQEFSFETSIQLDNFNSFILFFATSGDKTNGEGIKVTLSLAKVEVVCIIDRLFQDSLNHNLTQAFSYPEIVDGKMNVTITCEAQTSYSYYSGSLRIFSQTKAEKILPPTITESSFSLPVVPIWLEFKGSLSTVMRSVTTAFNNSDNFDKLNLSISFIASDFSAYLRQFEVQVNENIEITKDFEENQLTEETFFFSINPGLNFLTINFIVELCLDEIQLTNIALIGNGMNVESILPENTYDWLSWENNDFNYVFDLSSFKPVSIYLEQILRIDIQYGCFGTVISPAIYFEINLGTNVIDSGEISESEQINSPQTLFVRSPVTNYNDPLTFRIQGEPEGQGGFYILNTSYVVIEPLPELTEQDPLERELVETEVHHTPLSDPLVLTFNDFFKTDFDYLKCNISLSFSLTDEFGSSIRQIDVLMKLNWQTVIDHPLAYEDQINVTESEILYNNMYDVTIVLTIYGDGRIITLSNLKYGLLPLNSYNITLPEPPASPEESNSGREPIHPTKSSLLFIEYGIIVLGLTLLSIQILSKRKNKQESTDGETQEDDLEIQIVGNNTQFGHFSKLLQLPKNWYLKAKESLSRMILLILTVVHVVTNILCFSAIIDKLNEIAQREMQEVKLVVLGEVGFYCYMVCVYASTLVAFSAFYLASSDTFYEDFFRFTKIPGVFIFILFFSSWITLFIYIQQNSSNHGIAGTLFVPFIFLGIVIFLVWMGKTKEKQFERLVKNFFKTGRIKVSNIRRDNTETDSVIEEESLSSAQYDAHFQKIVNLIIQDISIKLQVPVNRFTELLGISPRLAHRLLIDVSNKIPKLGKYYGTEQIYIRSSDSEIGIDTLENMTEEKKGELISKYDKNSVNSEKTANNHDDMENQNNEKTAEDFMGNQVKYSQKTHQISLSRKCNVELTRHTELSMREVDGAFLRHHDIENEYDLIKKRIKKLPKSFYSKCIYKVFEEGVLGRINSELSVAHFLRILNVRAARDGGASLLELGAVGKKFLEDYSRIAEQIKEDWGDKSALVMILKSYRDMVLGTFRKFNDKQLNIWKGYLADVEVISNIYTKVDWANQYLHMRIIEEISDVSNYEDICSFANQIWEEEIQDIFVELASYGEIIPVTGYKVREIEIHSSMSWMDHMTTQNGILKFDIDKLLIDKKGFLDGRGPITLDIDQLGKNNVAINITSPEDTIKLFVERPGVDWNTYNIDAEFKIIDREKFTPSEARSLFSGVKYVKHSFADFLKKGALVNYFYDDSTKTLLDVEKKSLSYIESTIARRIYGEKGLHRIINSWIPTKYTIDGYNGVEGRLQIKKAVKLISSCAADDGIIPRLNFINCDNDLLKDNILRFERIYLTDKTIAGSIPFNIGKFSSGKFIIDVPQGFHISINTEVLKECLLLSKFQEKKGINLSSSNIKIEAAFQALIPQTTRRGVRGVFFIINDNGKFKPFVSSFKEIFSELYTNQLYSNIPIISRKNLFDVFIFDETGTRDCIGNGVMVQSNENGDIVNIIHHDFDSYISTVSTPQDTGQRIFLSASTYNEITKYDITDKHGDKWASYYMTLRGTTFENNQIKKNVEIPDQIVVELHRGVLPCFNPTSSGEIPAKVLRMKRVLLQSVLTTRVVPIISYQRGYQVRYIWLPLENAIIHLTTQLKDVEHDSVLSISEREEMISHLYDFLRKVGALHNSDPQNKQSHLIEKLKDTIKYYIKLRSYPKIDAFCQIIDTLGYPGVKELSFDPLSSGFLFFTILQESGLRNSFQTLGYSLDRLFNGYFQQTSTRKLVKGGDGYYLRHYAIHGKYPARGYNYYRTNGIDSIDIFYNFLLTDIELMQKSFINSGETTESIIDLLASQFKRGLTSKPTIYPLRAEYLKETYRELFGFIYQDELFNYIQGIDEISAMKIHALDKRQAFDDFSTYLSNLLNTEETLSNLKKEKMLGIIEYNEPKTSDDKIKIRLIFMDTTTEFKSYMRDSVGNQIITTWESSKLFSTLGENPLINLYRFQIFVKELGGRMIYDKKNSGAKILWIDKDSSLFLNPLMEELGQEKVSAYRVLFDIFGNAIGKELSGVKAQKNPHVRFLKHTEITDNIWFKAIPMIAFFEMKYYSVYSVEERLNKLGVDTSLRNNFGFLENSYVGAAIKYIQFDLTEVKTGEWCIQLTPGNYKGSEGFGTPLGNRIAETLMSMKVFTPFAVFTDLITLETDSSSASILEDEIERAIIKWNEPADDYEYINSKDKGPYYNKENKIWFMRILNRLGAIWGGKSFEY